MAILWIALRPRAAPAEPSSAGVKHQLQQDIVQLMHAITNTTEAAMAMKYMGEFSENSMSDLRLIMSLSLRSWSCLPFNVTLLL
jgi:hypothetical protein